MIGRDIFEGADHAGGPADRGLRSGESLTETEKHCRAGPGGHAAQSKGESGQGWRPYGPLDLPEEDILRRLAALAEGRPGCPG